MWSREESEVERAGRAPPSAPPTGSGGVSEDHQWRDEDPSWRQRELHLCGSLRSRRIIGFIIS